jgi:hypothetical protein
MEGRWNVAATIEAVEAVEAVEMEKGGIGVGSSGFGITVTNVKL